MEINKLTEIIIGCALDVHRKLGPGLLESTYHSCLCYELQKKGLEFKRQVQMPLVYDDMSLDIGYRLDLLIENKVVVELKSVDCLAEVHTAQVLTYLKLSGAPVGLLINFNVPRLTQGIKRLIHKGISV